MRKTNRTRRQEGIIVNTDATGRGRILLIAAGEYHDTDFVRRELLTLIAETDLARVTCTHDFAALLTTDAPDLLVTYTSNIFPNDAELEALRAYIAAGGKWLAIHASAAFTCFRPPEFIFHGIKLPGLTDTPDRHPDFMNLLGIRFVSHLPQQNFTVRPATPHPVTAGIPAFEVRDEPYILELRGPCEVLLTANYTGEAPGYVEGPWLTDDPRPQLLLHRHGAGEILYLAPGHACGRYDLRPFIDELPVQPGPWHVPEYRQLIRQAITWGTGQPPDTALATDEERAVERVAAAMDRGVDLKDWPAVRALHADTVLVDIGVVTGSAPVAMTGDEFVAELAAFNPPDKAAYHTRTQNRVTITGDTAHLVGNSYGYVRVEGYDPPTYEVWGSMEFTLARHQQTWRVAGLRMTKWRETGNTDVANYKGPA